jgi:hypothetical protein
MTREILTTPFPFFENIYVPVVFSILYLSMIFFLSKWMEKRSPIKLDIYLSIHNFILLLLSVIMFFGILNVVIKIYIENDFFELYCGSSFENNQSLLFWCYIFYLSKYYELLDTMFLILRKRKLTILHVWHHFSVLYLCWFSQNERMMFAWISAILNCFVHIIMYYYYFLHSISKKNIWWRKYLTLMQIIQFIIDIFTSILFAYVKLFTEYDCFGSWRLWTISNFIGLSFLYLFIDLYIKDNKSKSD